MLPLIEQHRDQIAALCRRHGVKRLELFGSAARGDFTPGKSDLDFFVEFLSDDWHGAADRWFGLQEDLEALLGRKIDLVSIPAATNPYFLEVANRHKVSLYAA
jgi:predicted nucleotidyltransferase